MTASSPLHQPIVASRQSANARVQILQGFSFRHLPAWAFGVTRSVWAFVVPAERAFFRALRLPRLERLALQGWPLLSGSLICRAGLRLQAVSARVSAFLFPILMTGCR